MIVFLSKKKDNALDQARTDDRQLIRLALYQLSYKSTSGHADWDSDPGSFRGGV